MAKGTEESYMQKYYQQQVEQNERDLANKDEDQMKVHAGYPHMSTYEQKKYDRKAAIRLLRKEQKDVVGEIGDKRKKAERAKDLKEYNKLLASVVTIDGKEYARTKPSRKKSFIPPWSKKFTERCVQKGDEVDALYMATVYEYFTECEGDDDGLNVSDWYYLSKSVHEQLVVFNEKTDFVLKFPAKDKAELVLNGKKPKRISRHMEYQATILNTVDDFREDEDGANAQSIDDAYISESDDDMNERILAKYIQTTLDDDDLSAAVDAVTDTIPDDGELVQKDLEKHIIASDAYKVYLLAATQDASRLERLSLLKRLTVKEVGTPQYQVFLYIATLLHRSGFKLLKGVVEFVKKYGGELTNCIEDDNIVGIGSRAIRILSNFDQDIIRELILTGVAKRPTTARMVHLVPILFECDQKGIVVSFGKHVEVYSDSDDDDDEARADSFRRSDSDDDDDEARADSFRRSDTLRDDVYGSDKPSTATRDGGEECAPINQCGCLITKGPTYYKLLADLVQIEEFTDDLVTGVKTFNGHLCCKPGVAENGGKCFSHRKSKKFTRTDSQELIRFTGSLRDMVMEHHIY